MLVFVLFAVVFFVGTEAKILSGGRPIVSGESSTERCPPCHYQKRNRNNALKCVAEAFCCPERASRTTCLLDPCLAFKSACPRAHVCVAQNCGSSGCSARYYDRDLNVLTAADCRRHLFGRERAKVAQRIRASGTARHTRPPGKSFRVDLGEKFLWPAKFEFRGSEKLGRCPEPTILKDLITVCSSECAVDSACPGRKKCCWNGCALRCVRAKKHPSSNFLNQPIQVQSGLELHPRF